MLRSGRLRGLRNGSRADEAAAHAPARSRQIAFPRCFKPCRMQPKLAKRVLMFGAPEPAYLPARVNSKGLNGRPIRQKRAIAMERCVREDDDPGYFYRRAEAELELAEKSDNPTVVAAHFAIAERYLDLCGDALIDEARAATDGLRAVANDREERRSA